MKLKHWILAIPVLIIITVIIFSIMNTSGSKNQGANPPKTPSNGDSVTSSVVAPSPEQVESDNRLNQHIVRCLTESYGLPKKEVENLLAAAGGVPNQKFREELFYKFGVKAPLNWQQLPRWPRAVPIGTTLEYTFKLKPGETSQVFAMLGIWAITIEPTDRSLSMDLDYILDPGQTYGRTVQYRPLPNKQNRYLDSSGQEVSGAARNSYQVALPRDYILPTGAKEVEFKVVMVRERNPDFNE